MRQLTDKEVVFEKLDNLSGHLYQGFYSNGTIAIVAGDLGRIGKLSVNLVDAAHSLLPNEFFVRIDQNSSTKYILSECLSTGLFEIVGRPFDLGSAMPDVKFQRWKLKKE